MDILAKAGVLIGTIIVMEALAWVIHKYILHGILWPMHKTHHYPQKGFWETNDLVALFYVVLSAGLIVFGMPNFGYSFFMGVGIAAYGVLYFWLHDVIIHQRIKFKYQFRSKYIKRLIRAHKKHHKHLSKNPSEAYGFLYAPAKYAPDSAQH